MQPRFRRFDAIAAIAAIAAALAGPAGPAHGQDAAALASLYSAQVDLRLDVPNAGAWRSGCGLPRHPGNIFDVCAVVQTD